MSSLIFHNINRHQVRPIPLENDDLRPVKGGEICQEAYANIFFCAKKKTGKTSAVFKVIKECMGRNTQIVVFCTTLYKDKNWIAIRKYFERKGIQFTGYTDLYEDGVNHLQELIEDLNEEAKDEEQEDEEEVDPCDRLLALLGAQREQDFPEEEEPKTKKSKYLAPDYIIVFDDLSHQLKSPSINALLKKNRHYKAKILLSSQWCNDLLPEQRKQIDLWLVFKGMAMEKLKEVHRDADIHIPFELFWKIYRKATKAPHSFLYIDTTDGHFRRNFDTLIQVKEPEDEE